MTADLALSGLLAVGLRLAGRRVLVAGGGAVGLAKVRKLLELGAVVRVVAPEAGADLQRLAAAGDLEWRPRGFQAGDLDGCHLVIAATGNPAVDQGIFAACEARALWCNAADLPAACSAYLMSQQQLGPVTVAVGTSGTAPGLANRLRREAVAGLPPDIAQLAAAYASVRRWLLIEHAPGPAAQARRSRTLRWLAAEPLETLRLSERDLRARVAAHYASDG